MAAPASQPREVPRLMASFVKARAKGIFGRGAAGRPWKAQRSRGGYQYSLGYFATEAEALAAEEAFEHRWPSMRGRGNYPRRNQHSKVN